MTAARLQRRIDTAGNVLGWRAGTDDSLLLGPMGMIFVPSVGGVSHSPRELTAWDDCARGANVLVGAIVRADQMRIDHL